MAVYMESIHAEKPPASAARRRTAGNLIVLLSIATMLPWLAGMTVYAAAAFGLRALIALPRTLIQAVDHAGDRALGH